MLNFNGGTTVSGASISSMGVYVGSLLLRSGDVAIAICFLALSVIYLLIIIATICRYIINYRRNKYLLDYKLK